MAIYSRLLVAGTVGGSYDRVAYTVPVGKVAIVRDVITYHNAGSPKYIVLYAVTPGVVSTTLLSAPDLESGRSRHDTMRQVLNPGDELHIASNEPNCQFRISGYELSI